MKSQNRPSIASQRIKLLNDSFTYIGFNPGMKCLAIAFGLFAASAGFAQTVDQFNLFKSRVYRQTSASQADFQFNFLGAGFTIDSVTSYQAEFETPNGEILEMTTDPNQTGFGYGGAALDDAAFEATFPNGTYQYRLKDDQGNVILDGDLEDANPLFSEIPLWSNFDDFGTVDANSDFQLEFDGFDLSAYNGVANDGGTYYSVVDSTGQWVAGGVTGFGPGAITLTAGTLTAGETYTAELIYSTRIRTEDDGFNGATSFLAYDQRTSAQFTAVPEPATLAMLGLGLAAALRRRRR